MGVQHMCEGKFWKAAPPAICSLFCAHCNYHDLAKRLSGGTWKLQAVKLMMMMMMMEASLVKKEGSKVTNLTLAHEC